MYKYCFSFFLSLCFSNAFSQYFDYPDLQGAQVELNTHSSIGIKDTVFDYYTSNTGVSFVLPIGSKKNDLFNYGNLFQHNTLEKSIRSKLFQLQLYGEFNYRYVNFRDNTYGKPGFTLGFKGMQYRPVRTFLLYDANYKHLPTAFSENLNILSGHLGIGSVSGSDKMVYFGLYGMYAKRVGILLPLIGFSARSSNKWESSFVLPIQLRVTRKWMSDKLWTDILLYVNGNITRFGYGEKYTGAVNELHVINLHTGKRLRYSLNKQTNLHFEAGYEFWNNFRTVIGGFKEVKANNVPGRLYIKFSLKYNFNKHNGVGHLFEFY